MFCYTYRYLSMFCRVDTYEATKFVNGNWKRLKINWIFFGFHLKINPTILGYTTSASFQCWLLFVFASFDKSTYQSNKSYRKFCTQQIRKEKNTTAKATQNSPMKDDCVRKENIFENIDIVLIKEFICADKHCVRLERYKSSHRNLISCLSFYYVLD